ncbi:MAG: 30S ribosomal protein S15 [Ignavibacteria bacterium]|nr:30S ribosomal protein S15 [Bacteroidota bacterium]MSQ45408.1 30S ribosomal protein S15 [Ignavibacteria bacterium]
MSDTTKQEIILKYGKNAKDAGLPEVQIAILTNSIKYMTLHIEKHKKDNHSKFGLLRMVSKRRKLLDYLIDKNIERYRKIIEQLGIRK